MSAYQSKLALGQLQQILDLIREGLPSFIHNNTWQELCREWLLLASANGEIPVPVADVGSEWAKNYTVDVVGISPEEKSLVLGNCFWDSGPGQGERPTCGQTSRATTALASGGHPPA